MGVLIKDMGMPKRCLDCPMYDCYYYNCQLYAFGIPVRYNRDGSTRPEWCELVELPEKHGRLIDADALAEQYVLAQEQLEKNKTDYSNAFMNNGEPCTEWWCVEDMLENAPTIIPAEEDK